MEAGKMEAGKTVEGLRALDSEIRGLDVQIADARAAYEEHYEERFSGLVACIMGMKEEFDEMSRRCDQLMRFTMNDEGRLKRLTAGKLKALQDAHATRRELSESVGRAQREEFLRRLGGRTGDTGMEEFGIGLLSDALLSPPAARTDAFVEYMATLDTEVPRPPAPAKDTPPPAADLLATSTPKQTTTSSSSLSSSSSSEDSEGPRERVPDREQILSLITQRGSSQIGAWALVEDSEDTDELEEQKGAGLTSTPPLGTAKSDVRAGNVFDLSSECAGPYLEWPSMSDTRFLVLLQAADQRHFTGDRMAGPCGLTPEIGAEQDQDVGGYTRVGLFDAVIGFIDQYCLYCQQLLAACRCKCYRGHPRETCGSHNHRREKRWNGFFVDLSTASAYDDLRHEPGSSKEKERLWDTFRKGLRNYMNSDRIFAVMIDFQTYNAWAKTEWRDKNKHRKPRCPICRYRTPTGNTAHTLCHSCRSTGKLKTKWKLYLQIGEPFRARAKRLRHMTKAKRTGLLAAAGAKRKKKSPPPQKKKRRAAPPAKTKTKKKAKKKRRVFLEPRK